MFTHSDKNRSFDDYRPTQQYRSRYYNMNKASSCPGISKLSSFWIMNLMKSTSRGPAPFPQFPSCAGQLKQFEAPKRY